MAFASQLQPSAPLWSKEVRVSECGMVRAPDSLPGLTGHFPHKGNRSPLRCAGAGAAGEVSPSSSEESSSPVEVCSYRRLAERAPLMARLARGLTAPRRPHSDDDSTPLVPDTPTTPTNVPLCATGGYINEASEAAARTRESNREPPLPQPPRPPVPPAPARLTGGEDFRRGPDANTSACGGCSSSSSSGGSWVGSRASGNNNRTPRAEPELTHAPWFQQGIPREIALEVLCGAAVGSFLVRGSTTQAGCWALSVRVPADFAPAGIAHYLILRTDKGYKIKGFTKEFSSLSALVTHHSVMPELLPVPLLLPAGGARGGGGPRDHDDIDNVAPSPRHRPRPPPPRAPHLGL